MSTWEKERKRQERMLDKMCYHKHIFKADGVRSNGQLIQQPPMKLNKNEEYNNMYEEPSMKRGRNKSVGNLPQIRKEPKRRRKMRTHRTAKKRKYSPINLQKRDPGVEADRRVTYKSIHIYGKSQYIVEISKSKKKFYIISIRLKDEKFQKIELFLKQGMKLVEFCGSTAALAERIEFKFKTMVVRDMQYMM